MSNRVKIVKNWSKKFIIFMIIIFPLINQNFILSTNNIKNSENLNYDLKKRLKSSFTFMFNESFQTLTFKNESITNSSCGTSTNSDSWIVSNLVFNVSTETESSIKVLSTLLFEQVENAKIINIRNVYFIVNLFSFHLPLTVSICKVGDCGLQTCQTDKMFKRATTVEFTTISPILYIHCYQLAVLFSLNLLFLILLL